MSNVIKKFTDHVKKSTIKSVINGLNSASDKNLVRFFSLMELITPKTYKEPIKNFKNSIKKNDPTIRLLRRILNDIDKNCKDKFLLNFIAQGVLINQNKKDEIERQGAFAPTTILVSPTMRCNLSCVGCYAGNYTKKDDMPFATFDKIINEAKEMGVSFFTVLGGEPLVYPHLFKIFKKHNDAYFQFYTNGALLTDETVKKLLELGNVAPMISIEGWEHETDERRGAGTYKKIMLAMDKLKNAGIPFGVSVAVTNKNAEIISSDKFMKFLVDKGAMITWWFLYMPVGKEPDIKLMPTPTQRVLLYKRGKLIRKKYPLFLIDFWNDAPLVGGCIAGKAYVHITPKGDVEPCIFTHFAADNINNKSLLEVMKSDYFRELRRRQPYDENLYMPCMWIDHPEVSREVHAKYNVYPTHEGADTILNNKEIRAHLDRYSKEVKREYDKIWAQEKNNYCKNCSKTCK